MLFRYPSATISIKLETVYCTRGHGIMHVTLKYVTDLHISELTYVSNIKRTPFCKIGKIRKRQSTADIKKKITKLGE